MAKKMIVAVFVALLAALCGGSANASPSDPPPNPQRLPVTRYWPPVDMNPVPGSAWEYHLTDAYWRAFRACVAEHSFDWCKNSIPADYQGGVRIH